MKDIEKIKILTSSTIEEALLVIDSGAVKMALVVDKDNKLLGTLSDGDIRRGLLRKKTLSDTIEDIYYKHPFTADVDSSKEYLLNLCSKNKISQVPILDEERRVVDFFLMDHALLKKQYENQVVLMVGGLGSRLKSLTKKTPKPMLNVGDKPLLQTIVKGFVDSGFVNFTMCLNYKAHLIEDYFQDGSDFGAKIKYVHEEKRMGTAGALTLIKEEFNKPFFVMNGDLLTNIDFKKLLDFHESNESAATMCVREHEIEVPYGVVNLNNEKIISIEEKPVHNFFVNAGIYILNPDCISLIPQNTFYDMPSLFETLIERNKNVVSFPLREYWMDVGKMSDYKKANLDHKNFFKF